MAVKFKFLIIVLVFILIFLVGVVNSCETGQVDINSASLSELDKIIWIGPATAQKIIDARPFEDLDDLVKVSGIGEIKLGDIKSEGVACVSGDSVEDESVEEDLEEVVVDESITKSGEKEESIIEDKSELVESVEINSNNQNENIIKLNSQEEVEQTILTTGRVVYESKNEKIKNYAIYFFAGFLIFVIVVLLIRK